MDAIHGSLSRRCRIFGRSWLKHSAGTKYQETEYGKGGLWGTILT